ncbi:NAD-dependent epimerase/dehydratase family protein [Methylobacterium radiodurans]|uniref:Epimerase n=1 Tax=Methylobacterium radiodurans TaxID=2202828 RepID=A0A2U8VWM2_9HYPH|nr:NAD-dependent epimerase/dehydratase family protein [Methylobacterium radiodurans]AWN38214.1 epimerase [Methylobacterium radiodurans]
MRIMVIGGNGFVGRPLTRMLADGHEVCVLDAMRYGPPRFPPEELARLLMIQADITDPKQVEAVMRTFVPEAVIHLAAIHYIPECDQDPVLAARTNVAGTVNLLAACPPGCRFVFASSGAVYAPEARAHREDTSPIQPSDIYGFTKLHGEHYVRHMARQRGLAAVVVRLFNVIGPGETNPHLLPEILAQLLAGHRRISLGNLTARRDYIHVDDAARGFRAAALAGAVAPGETVTVNLGTGQAYAVGEILARLRRIGGADFTVETDPARLRAVDRPVLAADIGRIRELFGWRPRHTIDTALADLWERPDLPHHLTAKYRPAPAPRSAEVSPPAEMLRPAS